MEDSRETHGFKFKLL